MSIDYVLNRLESLERDLRAHLVEHPLEHHDHLMDPEEHAAHHAKLDAPKEKRAGERRGSGERRQGGEDTREDKAERRAG